jgi:hypothetical protein
LITPPQRYPFGCGGIRKSLTRKCLGSKNVLRIVRLCYHYLRVDLYPTKEVSPPKYQEKMTMKSLQTPQKQSAPSELVPTPFLDSYNEGLSEPIASLLSECIHTSEEDLEEYLFGRLRDSHCLAIEFHLQHCELCEERLIAAAEFIGMMRTAIADALLCKKGVE